MPFHLKNTKPDQMPHLDFGKRLLNFLFLILAFILMGAALWPTCRLVMAYAPGIDSSFQWTLLILAAILTFSYSYLFGLLILRIIIPRPREGFFPRKPDGRPPPEAFIYMLNALLTKAHFHAPWGPFITSLLVNIFPLHYLFRPLFGPNTTSVNLVTYYCIDPCLIEAGKNVQFGGFCLITGHIFDNRGLLIRKIKIGNNVVIGARAVLMPGVKVGDNAIIGFGAFVSSETVIKPYEYWAGVPAKKIKDIIPKEHAQTEKECAGPQKIS